jgi:hypothetical protein
MHCTNHTCHETTEHNNYMKRKLDNGAGPARTEPGQAFKGPPKTAQAYLEGLKIRTPERPRHADGDGILVTRAEAAAA